LLTALLLMLQSGVGILCAQTIPAGSLLDEQVEIQSLVSDSALFSPVNRPLSATAYGDFVTGDRNDPRWWNRQLLEPVRSFGSYGEIGILPVFLQNTHNSRFPMGENNAAAWYGRGSSTEWKGGFYFTSDYVTLNLYPHLIYHENIDFLTPRFIPRDSNGDIRYVAEGLGAQIDAPFRFGPDSFTTLDPGNSSIRIHYKKLETGLSTESLWWGPAVRYPMVFSNNAAGFRHFFFSSRKPVSVPYFGDLQFKWILGYPKDSQYYDGRNEGQTRFTNALNFAYSPPFYENLTVGFIRVFHMYETNGFNFENAFLMFNPFFEQDFVEPGEEGAFTTDRNQIVSFYAHVRLPGSNAEIYAEYYREDRSFDLRDFINQPGHNSAYTFGFQKISEVPWFDFVRTNLEFTDLIRSQLHQVRFQGNYYTHSKIRQGHTNRGQILGAAIGPGSSSQYLSFDAYKNDVRVGLFVQRVVDNNNFHYLIGSADETPARDFGDYFRHRINLNAGVNLLYGPGPFYLNAKMMWTKAYNYGRFDLGDVSDSTIRNYERDDRINLQMQIGITYVY
jgi:hypothetical protein